jgi:iron complex transport system permease protein
MNKHFLISILLFLLVAAVALVTGPSGLALDAEIILSIRSPRVLTAIFTGAATAVAGSISQAMFRNALATPSVIGTEAGASFALALGVLLAGSLTGFNSFWAAVFGASIVTVVTVLLTQLDRSPSMTKLLLGGFAINALLAAATALCVSLLMERGDGLTIYHWLMGSFTARTWGHASTALVGLIIFGSVALKIAPTIDVMALGCESARAIGVKINNARVSMILLIAALSATSISSGGALPFIGLMAPHMARLLGRPHFRQLAPLAAVIGATLTLVADLCARTLRAPIDMDVGIITTIIGAPYFIWLLTRHSSAVGVSR